MWFVKKDRSRFFKTGLDFNKKESVKELIIKGPLQKTTPGHGDIY